jgi:hypothetical protein
MKCISCIWICCCPTMQCDIMVMMRIMIIVLTEYPITVSVKIQVFWYAMKCLWVSSFRCFIVRVKQIENPAMRKWSAVFLVPKTVICDFNQCALWTSLSCWTVNFSVKPTSLLLRPEVFMAVLQCLKSACGNNMYGRMKIFHHFGRF